MKRIFFRFQLTQQQKKGEKYKQRREEVPRLWPTEIGIVHRPPSWKDLMGLCLRFRAPRMLPGRLLWRWNGIWRKWKMRWNGCLEICMMWNKCLAISDVCFPSSNLHMLRYRLHMSHRRKHVKCVMNQASATRGVRKQDRLSERACATNCVCEQEADREKEIQWRNLFVAVFGLNQCGVAKKLRLAKFLRYVVWPWFWPHGHNPTLSGMYAYIHVYMYT